MYISQITLRDWKAFTTATFNFPKPENGKNIVLIGAQNGYGKTSLFEAILLGLYGRYGMTLIARTPFLGGGLGVQNKTYNKFLEKALHKGALEVGRQSCSVKLTFTDDDDIPLEIQRIWHFSDSGKYIPHDEEIHIFEGETRRAVGPGNFFWDKADDWYQDYIAKNLLPFTLAHFFMFDGEHVSVLAEREMSAQVRTGIEGLLGIPILKQLARDLRKYAENKRKESPTVSDHSIENLEQEYNDLTTKSEKLIEQLNEMKPSLSDLKKEQENLIRELGDLSVGSQALLQEQFEKIKNYERNVDEGRAQLESLLMNELAMALSGRQLRECVKKTLISEGILERWENSKNQGDSNLNRFLDTVNEDILKINPGLSESQREDVIDSTRNAWDKLWHPPPVDCAESYKHQYIREPDRTRVIEHLDEINKFGAPAIIDLLDSIASNKQSLKRKQDEVTRIETIAPHVDCKRKQLSSVFDQIENKNKKIDELQRELKAQEALVNQKKVELSKKYQQRDQAIPSARRLARATEVALMIDDIVINTIPSQIEALANAMTKAHHLMSHKKDLVDRIDIDENCEVRLLNAENMDLRGYDLSAGEKQIFTQALISAVSSISNRAFPMIIDTPLGRLDNEHRNGVLKHLVQRNHQVIMLSTNTEVVDEYLALISQHVQKKYLVNFELVGEIGRSTVSLGYFEGREEQT